MFSCVCVFSGRRGLEKRKLSPKAFLYNRLGSVARFLKPRAWTPPAMVSSSTTFTVVLLSVLAIMVEHGLAQKECTETVCHLNDTSLRFFLIGDWGGLPVWPYFTPAQKAVAQAMETIGDVQNNHFQMALGDNFYMIGVVDEHDPRFQVSFENVFNLGDSNARPWYVLAGNHDHYGNVTAQIQYGKNSSRWIFPDFFYPIKYELSSGIRVEIFVIDTVLLCGNTVEGQYGNLATYMLWGARRQAPQGPANPAKAEEQWRWLEMNLRKSKADYLFVAGHYPVWSIAEHGPSRCLVRRLRPLLQRYHVNAYFSGHDHNLQHLNETGSDGWRVHYVLSGAAAYEDNSNRNKRRVPSGSLSFFYPMNNWDDFIGQVGFGRGGFVFAEVAPEFAWFRYGLGDLREVHEFKSYPRSAFKAAETNLTTAAVPTA